MGGTCCWLPVKRAASASSAACASAGSAPARASAVSPSVRTYTRATRRSADMRTAVTVRSRSRGSFATRRKRVASSACTRWATRSGRRSAIAPGSVVEELEALLAHLGELEPVDEADDFAETAVHVRLLPSDLAHAEGRALPVIVVGAFRDRDVELVLYARLDRPQHAALALELVILGEQQLA